MWILKQKNDISASLMDVRIRADEEQILGFKHGG